MKVLLDTCVVSELRKRAPDQGVVEAVDALRDEDAFLSVITLGEIQKGILQLDPGSRRDAIRAWADVLRQHFADRILSIDPDTALVWGEITAAARRRGQQIGAADGLIAATALTKGLHLMTRNVSDFEPSGALLINPWRD